MQHDPQQPKSIWWLTKFDVIGFRVVRAVEEQENLRGLRSKVTRENGAAVPGRWQSAQCLRSTGATCSA